MKRFLFAALLVLTGCATTPKPEPDPLPPLPPITEAQAWKQITSDKDGTIWPGVFMGSLPDGSAVGIGFATNGTVKWRRDDESFPVGP